MDWIHAQRFCCQLTDGLDSWLGLLLFKLIRLDTLFLPHIFWVNEWDTSKVRQVTKLKIYINMPTQQHVKADQIVVRSLRQVLCFSCEGVPQQ